MKLTFSVLALPLTVIASPFFLETRSSKPNNIPSIRGNLIRITGLIKSLNTTLNAVPPNKPFSGDFNALNNDASAIVAGLQNITALANTSIHATHSQSNHIYRYLNQSTYMDTASLLDNFIVYFE